MDTFSRATWTRRQGCSTRIWRGLAASSRRKSRSRTTSLTTSVSRRRIGAVPEADQPMDEAGHMLLLAFDSESPEYARGFEAGRIWALLREADDDVEVEVHATNTEMVMRMAEATGRVVAGEVLDGTWTRVRFGAPE